uniref:Large ribosomal subunit protein bL33c n=1 Tax=Chondria tumulosa TaxID=2740715 RepID=A0A896SR84_9FLOR|nr:ribosomal protein L33 [Chondria tumulosa]QSD57107.1 ribosomal protein L33 [Chondria tumulosa]
MGKNKGARIIITLECECRNKQENNTKKRKSGIFRYTTSKNKRNTSSRLELKKFCKYCNCHANFKEIK